MNAAEATAGAEQPSLAVPRAKGAWLIGSALLAALAVVALWQLLPMTDHIRDAVAWIESSGPISIVVFYLAYVICGLIGIPRTLFNISAGFLFSYPIAIATVLVAAGSAHTLSFLIARTVARDWVERRISRLPDVKRLIRMVEAESFKVVFLLRLTPFVPAIVKGYGLGTTRIRFATYIMASMLGFLPLALAHVYLGWVGGEAMLDENGSPTDLERWLLYGGVFASIALVGVLYFYGRRAMNSRWGATSS